ncbi:hypothetical protein [Erythrobacter oryzae]|uniref:hypothetical protein n=1 Tax=Erythrobacter oryzae TaxID=3019556 RepID=UPI0025552138|nr:hypothetical protein [Erythrobacter sp. COR-2]
MNGDGFPLALRAPLWAPVVVAIAAGLLLLTRAIDGGTAVRLCSVSWLAWWVAAIIILIRKGFSTSPHTKHVALTLLVGGAFTYGVI